MPVDGRRGLPRQPMYYTLEQVASMLSLTESALRDSYLYLDGIDVGVYRNNFMRAVDFSVGRRHHNSFGGSQARDWRVAEGELIRWLTYHRLWLYPADPGGPYDPTALTYDEPVSGSTVRQRKRDPEELIVIEPHRT